MNYEEIVLQIIVSGGSARSFAMEAIINAKSGKINDARESISKAEKELMNAHQIQTKLIQDEAAGNKTEISLLMVHAQDHLMNAITVKDMAKEFVDLYEKINK